MVSVGESMKTNVEWCDGFWIHCHGLYQKKLLFGRKKNDGFFKENKSDINLYFIPHMFQALISFFFFFSFLLHGPYVYTATIHESCCTSKVIYLLRLACTVVSSCN